MKTLQDLFIEELADVYDTENRLSKAFPKMARAATYGELTEAFQTQVRETEEHMKKLDSVFDAFGMKRKAKKCDAAIGLLKEGNEILSRNKGQPTINAALISVGQKAKHHEIASYGCLAEWAKILGNNEAARVLDDLLDEEKATDRKFTEMARSLCNQAANRNTQGASPDELFRAN